MDNHTTPSKCCSKCGIEKPLSEFHNDKKCKCGKVAACKACVKARGMKYREENTERLREAKRQYYQNNKEVCCERNKKYQEALHRQEATERTRRWKQEYPEKAKANEHRREARKRGNGGSFSANEWLELCEKYDRTCLCCGRSDVKLTADHVIPVSKGGSSLIDNIQPLCASCNSKKHDKIIDFRVLWRE